MRPPRHLIALIISLAALLAAAGFGVAAADEGSELEAPANSVLLPGYNYVGWVGAPVSVASLKTRFPEIESIRAWDALLQRSFPPSTLTPGMGVRIEVSGEDAIKWQRPMTPVKGKVELRRGRNLVAWLGPDDWPIDRVVLGIGRSIIRAEWNSTTYDPDLNESIDSMPLVKRGDALWIEVSRAVNWLQPAGVMPKLEFAGQATEAIKNEVRRDSLDVMNHYAREFGIQPDGSTVTVRIATDVEALIKFLELDEEEAERMRTSWYGAGGWTDGSIVVLKLEQWDANEPINQNDEFGEFRYGRYVMAHEYYHVMQYQLSNGFEAGTWLVEGGAEWAEVVMRQRDLDSTAESSFASFQSQAASPDAPPLYHTERRVGSWPYTIGALAWLQLTNRSSAQLAIEFWREQLPELSWDRWVGGNRIRLGGTCS